MADLNTVDLKLELRQALLHKLTALADDELVLGHRNSEWTGHAPILEEDIALANLAQDELGHALLWYGLVQEQDGGDPDALVYFRKPEAYRNAQMLELPKGDWAFTMLRQYLFDAYEYVNLARLAESTYVPLAETVAKIRKEEMFHLRHSHAWTERLGLGTPEANRRMQAALETLWPAAQQLFVPLPDEHLLVNAALVPDLVEVEAAWLEHVTPHLETSGLTLPTSYASQATSRAAHTDHLTSLLEDLQQVARLEPQGIW
ncbi:phenylacetate-CoA oxygenase subunit PaaC [soil metagenome]